MASLFNPSELYDILARQGALPQWAQQRPYTSANAEYNATDNRVIAPSAADPRDTRDRSSLSHEMSHAVQFQLFMEAARKIQEKRRNDEKVTPEETRFLNAAQKMYLDSFGTIGQGNPKEYQKRKENLAAAVNRMYAKDGKDPQYDSYRTSPVELQAFGIGRFTDKGEQRQSRSSVANGHLDPSFATEFALLLEMFKRLPEDTKTRRKALDDFINKSRQSSKEPYQFEDITADPFKPSIK